MSAAGTRATTDGALLGGRVRHRQFADGHRTGIEPVLLAAAVPARPGARVLEAGTGSGAALLCLAARVPGLRGVGVERDAVVAALARCNFKANNHGTLEVETAAIECSKAAGGGGFDHAMANPPWHEHAATPSPDPGRDAAHRGDVTLPARWTARLARGLVAGGTLTVIVTAAATAEYMAALVAARMGGIALLPLWPRDGVAAKLVLVRARRDGRGPTRVLPGLTLHQGGGDYTEAAEAVLRGGAALDWAG